MKKILIAVLLVYAALGCRSSENSQDTRVYRIGYMICNSEQETLHRFRPLTSYLSKKLGVPLEAVAVDTVDFTRQVDKLDFTHTNSLLYIIIHRNHGIGILAAEKAGSLGARSRGAIVVLKKSGITTLHALRGKSMIFGPMFAPTAYLTQLDLLIRNGIDPENDLSFYTIPTGSFKHEKVIYGILFGKYDAGAVPMLDFERMVRDDKISKDDFRVLAEGDPILYCNFGATQKVEDRLAKAFQKALLALTKDDTVEIDGEVVKVLERANVDGYEEVQDRDFDSVREMAKRTNMPPYQRF